MGSQNVPKPLSGGGGDGCAFGSWSSSEIILALRDASHHIPSLTQQDRASMTKCYNFRCAKALQS